ncbi:hypothetical protein [Afipia sp. GAS231]|uniref:hypothetical protein n=1 Tax=Afipia sp. GAS231 TaxID=1882747 RepID=UPI0012F77F49|nr:hypothetical protein [Afipia sp. GAS231]
MSWPVVNAPIWVDESVFGCADISAGLGGGQVADRGSVQAADLRRGQAGDAQRIQIRARQAVELRRRQRLDLDRRERAYFRGGKICGLRAGQRKKGVVGNGVDLRRAERRDRGRRQRIQLIARDAGNLRRAQ